VGEQPSDPRPGPGRRIARAARLLYRWAFARSAARTAVASFACIILFGTLLLCLPISSKARVWSHPVDAVFTATSAVCVTGLIVKSTPDYWSFFGQLVILGLIQVGGLGIMTMGAFVAIMLQRKLSMRFEAVMTGIVESAAGESVWGLIRFICMLTLAVEVAGTMLLFFAWRSHFSGFGSCLYSSVFHSVSAFCNAGFSLNNNSLEAYVGNPGVNFIICGEIVIGGIGFMVVRDVMDYAGWWLLRRRGKRPRLSTHSKLVLTVTAVLLAVGMVIFLAIEWNGDALKGTPAGTKVLAAMFQSVTPRTAGFNTVDISTQALGPATVFMLMALMYVGGSPGGTAGGIKTSTLGIMISSIIATLKGRQKAEMFHHSVPEETVHRVAGIILLSVGALVVGIFLLLITDTSAGFYKIAFESVSAFGTVGLSLGLTGPNCDVTWLGKLILAALMFIGRLGPVTLMLGVAQLRDHRDYRYPEDRVLVG
jgi:trk system potassium uptake protein TrkH